jgi:ABC-type uncharacterized transport system permease subunit
VAVEFEPFEPFEPAGVATKLIGVIQGVIVLFVGIDLVFRRLASRIIDVFGGGEPVKAGAG